MKSNSSLISLPETKTSIRQNKDDRKFEIKDILEIEKLHDQLGKCIGFIREVRQRSESI